MGPRPCFLRRGPLPPGGARRAVLCSSMPPQPDSDPSQQDSANPSSGGSELLERAGRATVAGSSEYYSPIPDGYVKGRHKYVVVLGTVMSGLGKGIFASSLAKLIGDKGLTVAPIKMEGYLNIDAGTLNPYRHGEVFVLDDGTECDMDLGTYERMLDQDLTERNFTTSGRIFRDILDRERHGVYLGRDVQMIPHVTGEVKRRLRELALRGNGRKPADVVFVEVGGTVGDYENGFYIEALRELAFEEGPDSCCFVALTYVIEPPSLGEQKSKAAQLGVKRLLEAGIQPHIIACRATHEVDRTVMEKIALFTNVPAARVFSMHDRPSIYTIPEELRAGGLDREVLSILNLHGKVNLPAEDRAREEYGRFLAGIRGKPTRRATIAITGKYAHLRDAYASIDKALEHCAAHLRTDIDLRWIETTDVSANTAADTLKDLDGVVVPGGFGSRGVDGKIEVVRYCRENGVPYLGICLGFQVAVIEFARNVLGFADASSSEFDPEGSTNVISELPEQKKIEGLGGTMRLGAQDVLLTPGTLAHHLFGNKKLVKQRFRHRYEVDPTYIERLEAQGLHFSGRHPEQPIMQFLELAQPHALEQPDDGSPEQPAHPYFVAGQFHPELLSRPLRPMPMFLGLVAAAASRNATGDASTCEDQELARVYMKPSGSAQPA